MAHPGWGCSIAQFYENIERAKQAARSTSDPSSLSPLESAFYHRLVELNQHPLIEIIND